MEDLIKEIAKQHFYDYNELIESKLPLTIKKVIYGMPNSALKQLYEARDNNYASYEIKKDKIIASVSAQKASAFTSLAKSWKELDSKVSELEIKKRELNEIKKDVDILETDLKDKIRDKVSSIFDDSEQTMTLVVECLNSTFTLDKLTETHKDKITTPAGEIISTDYQEVIRLLLLQNSELKSTVDGLIKQCSVIASDDVIKKGAKRGVRVKVVEGMINEGLFNRVMTALTKFKLKITNWLSNCRKRQSSINSMLNNLQNI